jgi:2-iminobutanoate/2-iminopropanoate deaminase
VQTDEAPTAIGPYSQAIRVGDFLFTSGQLPVNPETDRMVDGDIAVLTGWVLRNLDAVIVAAGGRGLADVVRTTVYLTDPDDFSLMNRDYQEHFERARGFNGQFPARSTVFPAGLPKNSRIEMDCIAYIDPR